MVKCAECGQIFGSTQALSSHVRNVHGVGPKTENQVESDNGILDLKKEVKRAELSARLQRLRTSMEGGKLDLLFLELDRLGREVSHLKKSNEDLRSTIATFEDKFLDSETFSNFFSLVGSTMSSHTSAINELNKLVGQSMVLEGWRLTTDQFGLYNLQGLGDNRPLRSVLDIELLALHPIRADVHRKALGVRSFRNRPQTISPTPRGVGMPSSCLPHPSASNSP